MGKVFNSQLPAGFLKSFGVNTSYEASIII
jgi:hypothetical protein